MEKLIIIGGGPAALAAAIYAARAQLVPVVMVGEKSGGQLMLTTEVENFPGMAEGIMGPELMQAMKKQAEKFGARIREERVTTVSFKPGELELRGGSGEETRAEAVIVATGAEALSLGIPGEAEYMGRGVSYCAICDAAFFKEKEVVVVGGGDAAMEEALALAKFANKVTIVHRRDSFRASRVMQERVLKHEKIEVWWRTEVEEIVGEGVVRAVRVKSMANGQTREVRAEGVFVAIGHRPATEFLRGQVAVDEKGYIKTGVTYPQVNPKSEIRNSKESFWLHNYPTMASVPGVFAAGDNVDFRYRQAATAAGMGVMAALDAEKWLEGR